MSLTELPALLREEPAVAQVLGRSSAVLAVPDPARALTLAGLATISLASPAARGRADHRRRRAARPRPRAPSSGDDRGRAVPGLGDAAVRAGEPRRRDDGSPPAHASGACATRDRCPAVVVAPVRALVQRLGPHVDDVEPLVVRRRAADRARRAGRLAGRRRLPPRAAGRAPRRGGGPRLDRRRVPVDRRRPDPHRPLGRRGRPAHRVLGQRPALHDGPRRGRDLPVPRAAARPTTCGRAPRSWSAPSPGAASSGSGWPRARSSTAWSPGCRGSSTTSGSCVDLLPATALVLLVEPRRMRDRAGDLLAEEADLAASLARTWERRRRRRTDGGRRRSRGCTSSSIGCWPTPRCRSGP